MRCTATGNYISTDETDKTKVAQNGKEENSTRKRKRLDEMLQYSQDPPGTPEFMNELIETERRM